MHLGLFIVLILKLVCLMFDISIDVNCQVLEVHPFIMLLVVEMLCVVK